MERELIVITGGKGFVGQHLQRELQEAWPEKEIVLWDLPEVDITKPETYENSLRTMKPEWVIHLAAVSAVGSAESDPELAMSVNVDATEGLLQRVPDGTRVLAVSSSEIYGLVSSTPLPELSLGEAAPKSLYGKTKLEMEKMIEKRFNPFVVRVRPFPHIGPGQGVGFVTADFASQIASIEVGRQDPVIRVGNLEAERDFTDVRDVVRAYRLLMEKGDPGEVYHVASGAPVSIQSILDQLLSLSEADITVEQDETRMRPSDNPVSAGDASKLREATGWQPTISLSQSLQDILDDWRRRV